MTRPMSIAKRTQLAGLLVLGCVSAALAAEKLAELSDDFLEYLGSMEGDDETWMDFAGSTSQSATSQPATPAATGSSKPMAAASSSASSRAVATNTNAASHATGKAEQ